MTKKQNLQAFAKELYRVQVNAIYFLEEYWNKMHPEMRLDLTDQEKARLFTTRREIPVFKDAEAAIRFLEHIGVGRKQGLKDWEIS